MSSQGALRIAVIGAGKVAQNLHLPAIEKSTRCELVAVCDASLHVAQAVGTRYSVPGVYDSVDAVLGDDAVEAVLIAVGDPLHVHTAMAALDAGKHVFVEKPLGVTASECAPLADKVLESGLMLQVGTMKRFDPGIEYVRDAVEQQIGPVVSFDARYLASADEYIDESSIFVPVIRDPDYVRPGYKLDLQPYYLATHGVHLFDQIRFVLGAPASVQAIFQRNGDRYSWHGLLRMVNGAIGHFELSVYVESEWSEGLRIFGERGSAFVETPNPFFLRSSQVRVFDAGDQTWHSPTFPNSDAYLRQLDAFAASVRDGEPAGADVAAGIAALEMIEAVERSVDSGGGEVVIDGR